MANTSSTLADWMVDVNREAGITVQGALMNGRSRVHGTGRKIDEGVGPLLDSTRRSSPLAFE